MYDIDSKYNYTDFINNEFEKITINRRDDHNKQNECLRLQFQNEEMKKFVINMKQE